MRKSNHHSHNCPIQQDLGHRHKTHSTSNREMDSINKIN